MFVYAISSSVEATRKQECDIFSLNFFMLNYFFSNKVTYPTVDIEYMRHYLINLYFTELDVFFQPGYCHLTASSS